MTGVATVDNIVAMRQLFVAETRVVPTTIRVAHELWQDLICDVAEHPAEWTGRYAIEFSAGFATLLGMRVVRGGDGIALRGVTKLIEIELDRRGFRARPRRDRSEWLVTR